MPALPAPPGAEPPPEPGDERALIAASIGRNAELYADAIDRSDTPPVCLTAILFPAPWAMYRKLWAVGAGAFMVPTLIALVIGYVDLLTFVVGLGLARWGKPLVVARARATIGRLRAVEPDPERLRERVAAQGGVSRLGAAIGLVALFGPLAASALGPAAAPSPGPAHVAGPLERAGALAMALAPGLPIAAILLAWSVRRVPLPVLGVALCMGALAVFCAVLGSVAGHLTALVPDPALRGAVRAFVAAALPEEAAKLALLVLVVLRQDGADRARDAPLAGAFVGLGFALMENAFYVVGQAEAATLALARAATAVPFHAALGLAMGWCLAGGRRRSVLLAFVVPVLLHGSYNLPLFVDGQRTLEAIVREPAWGFGLAGLLCLTWLVMRRATSRPAPEAPPPGALDGRVADRALVAARLAGGLILLAVGLVPVGATAALFPWQAAYAVLAILPLAFADLAWRAAPAAGRRP